MNVKEGSPCNFRGAVVARFLREDGDPESYEVLVTLVDMDNKPVFSEKKLPLKSRVGQATQVVVDLQVKFPSHGQYEFRAIVDGEIKARWPFDVEKTKGDKE